MFWVILFFFIFIVIVVSAVVSKATKTSNNTYNRSRSHNHTFYEYGRGIRNYRINGMKYQNLTSRNYGDFEGHAIATTHPKDRYCIEIRNDENQLLGYIPAGNASLHSAISKHPDKKSYCFGRLEFDEKFTYSYGDVNIALFISKEQMHILREIEKIQNQYARLLDKKTEFIPKQYFRYFENYEKAKTLQSTLGFTDYAEVKSPAHLIPAFSRHLEQINDWENLSKLSEHIDLINEVNHQFRNATFKRIEKANIKKSES